MTARREDTQRIRGDLIVLAFHYDITGPVYAVIKCCTIVGLHIDVVA